MPIAFQFIDFENDGDVVCARLRNPRVDDERMEDLGMEMSRLIDEMGVKKLVFCLGPEEPDCLLSVFLAKLIGLRRRLDQAGGALALAHVSEHTRGIFRAAGIEKLFDFYPDQPAATLALHASGGAATG